MNNSQLHIDTIAEMKRLRKSKEYSQQRLAELIFKSSRTYKRLESGISEMNLNTISRVAKALNCEARVIFYQKAV